MSRNAKVQARKSLELASKVWESDDNLENAPEFGKRARRRVSRDRKVYTRVVLSSGSDLDSDLELDLKTESPQKDQEKLVQISYVTISSDSEPDTNNESPSRSTAPQKRPTPTKVNQRSSTVASTVNESERKYYSDSSSESSSDTDAKVEQAEKSREDMIVERNQFYMYRPELPHDKERQSQNKAKRTPDYRLVNGKYVLVKPVPMPLRKRKSGEMAYYDSDADSDFLEGFVTPSHSSRSSSPKLERTQSRKPSAKRSCANPRRQSVQEDDSDEESSDDEDKLYFDPEKGLRLFKLESGALWMEDRKHPKGLEKKYYATVHTLKEPVFNHLMETKGIKEEMAENKREGSVILARINITAFALDLSDGQKHSIQSIEICQHHTGTQVRINWPVVKMTEEEAIVYHANNGGEVMTDIELQEKFEKEQEKKQFRELQEELKQMKEKCLEEDKQLNAAEERDVKYREMEDELKKTKRKLHQKKTLLKASEAKAEKCEDIEEQLKVTKEQLQQAEQKVKENEEQLKKMKERQDLETEKWVEAKDHLINLQNQVKQKETENQKKDQWIKEMEEMEKQHAEARQKQLEKLKSL